VLTLKDVVIACDTLRDEIDLVYNSLKVNYPIVWVDSGLHNFPEKLNKAIQDEINKVENVENIILMFGTCGNSIVGLSSEDTRIIFPAVEDCISMFLGGDNEKRNLEKEATAYYFTRGYLENDANIWSEYMYSVNKYGREKSKEISLRMFQNYQKVRVLDTGAFDPDEVIEKTEEIANEFELKHELVKGTLDIIYRAFNKEWDKGFVIKEAGEKITYQDVGMV